MSCLWSHAPVYHFPKVELHNHKWKVLLDIPRFQDYFRDSYDYWCLHFKDFVTIYSSLRIFYIPEPKEDNIPKLPLFHPKDQWGCSFYTEKKSYWNAPTFKREANNNIMRYESIQDESETICCPQQSQQEIVPSFPSSPKYSHSSSEQKYWAVKVKNQAPEEIGNEEKCSEKQVPENDPILRLFSADCGVSRCFIGGGKGVLSKFQARPPLRRVWSRRYSKVGPEPEGGVALRALKSTKSKRGKGLRRLWRKLARPWRIKRGKGTYR